MIESLNAILPIFVYVLLIVLLVVGIVLGIKLIITLDKVNIVVDDITEKVSSLNNIFRFINGISDRMSILSSKIIDTVISLISKIGNSRGKEEDEDE